MSNNANEILGESGTALISVGHGNFIAVKRIVAILETGSLPTKRLRERAAERNLLVDATAGRKMRSLIVTDAQFVLVSALSPQTLQDRLMGSLKTPLSAAHLEWKDGEFVS
jgi:regulator of extracellular matrix RemA (YlzA/DUF370 family)